MTSDTPRPAQGHHDAGSEPEPTLLQFLPMFTNDPAVGVTLVDDDGTFLYINERAVRIFGGDPASNYVGRTIHDLFDARSAHERLAIVTSVIRHNQPAILRSIRQGVRIQSTAYPLPRRRKPGRVLVITVEGEAEPGDAPTEIFESEVLHLGPLEVLSLRELEVLVLIGQGMSLNDIARTLHRSPRTIEKHRRAISDKLGTQSRVTLGQIAARAGLTLSDLDRPRAADPPPAPLAPDPLPEASGRSDASHPPAESGAAREIKSHRHAGPSPSADPNRPGAPGSNSPPSPPDSDPTPMAGASSTARERPLSA